MNTFALRRVYAPRPNQRLFSFPVSLGCLLLTVVLFWLLFGRETLLHAQDTAQIPEIHFGAPLLVTDTMEGIHSVVAADLEGDGDLDLVAVSRLDGKVAWFRNDGGIRPALPGAQLATLDGAYAVQAADLNRDGIMDFVVAAVGEVRPSSVPDASIQTPTGKIVWFIGTSTSTPRYEQQVIS